MLSFFHLSIGVTGYFHDISRYIHDWHDIYMIFYILFWFCTCIAHNLAENHTNLAEHLEKIPHTGMRIVAPFMRKSFWSLDHYFQLIFPKESQNPNSLDIGIWEVGAKRLLNGVGKCDGQTHTQTFWFFENWVHQNLWNPLFVCLFLGLWAKRASAFRRS